MTNRTAHWRVLLLAAAFFVLPAAALAQSPPTSLLPAPLGQQQVPPADANPLSNQLLAPQPAPQPQPFPAPVQQAQPAPQPAPGGTLGTIPAGTLGTIPQSSLGEVVGGAVNDALAMVDGPLPSAGAQRAMREVLRDRALAQTSDPLARAGALYAIGFAEDAAGAAIEANATDVAGRALTARTLLAVGQTDQACRRADVDEVPQDAAPEPTFELLEVLALCKLEQGTPDAASLIAGLIREQGGSDPLFFAGIDAATGSETRFPPIDQVRRVRPIHRELLRRAGVAIPTDFVARADLALIPAIARDELLDADVRIAATERAAASGLADAGSLVGLYGLTPLAEDLLMQVATGAAPGGPLARAHMFALIAEARDANERLRFVETMYRQGRAAGVGTAIAEALGEDVAGIQPSPLNGQSAPLAAEILVRADRARAAVGWVDAGELPGPGGQPALSRFDAHKVRALIAMLAPDAGVGVVAGAFGADAGGGGLSEAERAFITAEVTFMTALGDFVSPILAEIAGRPAPPHAGAGPAALIAALAPLAGQPLAETSAEDIASALAALAASGLEIEARRLAVEALVARSAGG